MNRERGWWNVCVDNDENAYALTTWFSPGIA